jgi:hypothetical protein
MSDKQVIFVLGTSRSGTSLLAGALIQCGAGVPHPVFGPSTGNLFGHWEPLKALELNDEFLLRHGTTWYDPTLRFQNEIVVPDDSREAYIREIMEFLRECPDLPTVVIKEPRITALSDFWFEACRRAGFTIKTIIAVRHPDEVVESLRQRDGTSAELGTLLWLKYSLLAERCSRGLPRIFVEYANTLQDWRRELQRIADSLAVDLELADAPAMEAFVNHALRRQKSDGAPKDLFGERWTGRAYDALSRAARAAPTDTETLDSVFAAFSVSEGLFQNALAEYRDRFSPQQLLARRADAGSTADDIRREMRQRYAAKGSV